MVPDLSASISFMIFIASMMQIGSPSLTNAADLDERLGAGGLDRAVEGADHRRLATVERREFNPIYGYFALLSFFSLIFI
jgi:hypothetical protein